jgi:PIN domain nuclease of toxin-antitoxin system
VRALLDTHAFLWWNADDPRLTSLVRGIFEDTGNELLLSVVSAWEIVIKVGKGHIRLPLSPDRYVLERQQEQGLIALPVELAHAFAVADLPRHHADPFDRLLVAQARVEGIPIVTSDPAFNRYEIETLW